MAVAPNIRDPAHIEIQVTPFYDAAGPKIKAGTFSVGLAWSEAEFKNEAEWKAANSGVNEGLNEFLAVIKEQRAHIHEQRVERGVEARFSKLTSKDL